MKLYSLRLGELGSFSSLPISRYQFAFRKGYQAHEVVSTIRLLAEKAIEIDEALFIFDGDLHKAYDKVRHTDWIRSHQRRGIPKILTAAWVREVRRGRAHMKLPGQPATSGIVRERSMLQRVDGLKHSGKQGWSSYRNHS